MMIRPSWHHTIACVTLLIGVMSCPAIAEDKTPSIESIARNCMACHGREGESVTPMMPSIRGMAHDDLVATLRAFRDNTKDATIMNRLMAPFSDNDIENLARYFQ
ncbi:MAG: c-type cytochrome [Alphaproteobacteria bacterium GM7ARS4]|nr:c-type cytochrome [Alphaproteobacteria bacterium GM7ARS4]